MAYQPETKCSRDQEIRAEMARENYAGHWNTVIRLCLDLNEHHKTCPVCQGVPLADLLFGKKVTVVP